MAIIPAPKRKVKPKKIYQPLTYAQAEDRINKAIANLRDGEEARVTFHHGEIDGTNFRPGDLEGEVRSGGYHVYKDNGSDHVTWKIGYGCTPSLTKVYYEK